MPYRADAILPSLQKTQIITLQQIGENLAAQTRRLEGLTVKVDDVRERLVRLEAQEAGKLVEGVRGDLKIALERLDALEAQRDRVVGVAWFWGWISRSAPWLAAGLAAVLALMGLKDRAS
ncbi:MAG: hypothetical protein CGW95_13505 [Phenylobacterium zucineum]|nr:MAG: hypothetical protein CGW95_13505 [Phenylobacterium zucineum]